MSRKLVTVKEKPTTTWRLDRVKERLLAKEKEEEEILLKKLNTLSMNSTLNQEQINDILIKSTPRSKHSSILNSYNNTSTNISFSSTSPSTPRTYRRSTSSSYTLSSKKDSFISMTNSVSTLATDSDLSDDNNSIIDEEVLDISTPIKSQFASSSIGSSKGPSLLSQKLRDAELIVSTGEDFVFT